MNYKDLLKGASKQYCQRIAGRIGVSRGLEMPALRDAIREAMLDAASLKMRVERLTSYERSTLAMLAYAGGEMGVSFDQFNRKLNLLSQKWTMRSGEVLRALTEAGFVFTITGKGMSYHYVVPEDLRLVLLPLLADEVNTKLTFLDTPPKEIRNDGLALVRDVFTFLCFASQYGVGLTKQGVIYKRVQKRLLNAFEVSQDTPKVYERINPLAETTDRLQFIHHFCQQAGLLKWSSEDELTCSHQGKKWAMSSHATQLEALYAHWHDNYLLRHPPMLVAQSILHTLPTGVWVRLSSIQEQVARFAVNPAWNQTLYSQLERVFVNHLTYMGVIAFAALNNDVAIQLTPFGEQRINGKPLEDYTPESNFILQPNLEILASSYLEPSVRWMLHHIAELHRANQVATFKLTAQSIYDGLRSGVSLDALLTFLRTHSRTGLPQNVEISIVDWAARYGQVYLMDVMLLRCQSETLAHELKASKQFGKYIIGELSSKDLIVSRQKATQLLALLEKHDYMPLPEIVTHDVEAVSRGSR